MNKSDLKLILILLLISFFGFCFFKFFSRKGSNAFVYHDGNLVLTIDLNIDNDYVVQGDNGDVSIIVRNGKIKVSSENSPLHLCSLQGFVDDSNQSIVCLPNKIVINIGDNLYDAVVK
jgi:hypothetical protein